MIDLDRVSHFITNLRASPTLVLMDTEQTCWPGSWERRQTNTLLDTDLREVIQIGAIKVRTDDFSVIDVFERVVRPAINPTLSPFCIDFTGIAQERLDAEGVSFPKAFDAFETFVSQSPVMVYNADADVFRENLVFNGLDRVVPNYLRIREHLQYCGVDMTDVNSGAIARHLGSQHTYREHDALADVHSMADGLAILANSLSS